MTTPLRPLLTSLLIGAACGAFLLAFHLVILVQRFTTDLPEVLATYDVIQSSVIVGSVLLTGGILSSRGKG